jgi:hypothetical protein
LGRPEPTNGGLLFVGNTRGVSRPIVAGFSKAGLPLELIGAGWEQLGLQAEATSIANQQLPARYRRALAVLNDHHQAMADYGYLNNRVFDVLACAVPVITDVAPGCPPELEPAVIRHAPGSDARASLEQARALRLGNPARRWPVAWGSAAGRVGGEHSEAECPLDQTTAPAHRQKR